MTSVSRLLGAFLCVVYATGCGQSGEGDGKEPPGAASGGEGGAPFGGTGEGAGFAGGCEPACAPPLLCSVTRACIEPGTCAADGDCTEAGTRCDTASKTCVPGGACGGQEVALAPVAPNLLILLDRSCSMTDRVSGASKWSIAVQALSSMIAAHADRIRFGLDLFPDRLGEACSQEAITVPVAPDSGAAISDLLNAALVRGNEYFPSGPCATNIDAAVALAAAEPALADPDRKSYVLLLTDGKQSDCRAAGGDAGTEQTLADIYQNKGVPTFVLGFGDGVDPVQMDLFAEAGGVPSTGAHKYYDAADQASLDATLNLIATTAISCSYVVAEAPMDQGEIYVFVDNIAVGKDTTHQSGWDYEPASREVTFYGTTCDDLRSGAATDIDIVFGCAQPTPD